MPFFFDVVILMWTPEILVTSSKDNMFAMDDFFIWIVIGKISISPILLKYRCPRFSELTISLLHYSFGHFLAKYAFSAHLLMNMFPIAPNCC